MRNNRRSLAAEYFDRTAQPTGPRTFVRRGRTATSSVIVCAGDSITNGTMSANYVQLLKSQIQDEGVAVVNAGIGGDLAHNLLGRLDDVIACRPHVVTVLIGTNDVAAHVNDNWRDYYMKHKGLAHHPTIATYKDDLESILGRLLTETKARVALLTLPPLGEDLATEHNARIRAYNEVIKAAGARPGVTVLDLHDRLVASLPSDDIAPYFDGSRRQMARAMAQRLLLRRSYDEIARRGGFRLLIDHVHLNDAAGRIVADIISEFLHA